MGVVMQIHFPTLSISEATVKQDNPKIACMKDSAAPNPITPGGGPLPVSTDFAWLGGR